MQPSLSLHVQTWQHHPLVVSWLWSSTCDASKSELEGFLSKCKAVTVSQSHQLKHGMVPVKQIHAQPSLARGLGLGRLGWPLVAHPPAPRNTQKHNCCRHAGLDPDRFPSPGDCSVTSLTLQCSSGSIQHGNCATWWAGAAGQGSRAQSQCPGQAAAGHTCLEGQLRLWIALRASSQILQSYLTKPFCDPLASSCGGGSAAYIYTYVYLCVTVYIHLCTICVCTCMHMYVCVGRCIKKIFYLMK